MGACRSVNAGFLSLERSDGIKSNFASPSPCRRPAECLPLVAIVRLCSPTHSYVDACVGAVCNCQVYVCCGCAGATFYSKGLPFFLDFRDARIHCSHVYVPSRDCGMLHVHGVLCVCWCSVCCCLLSCCHLCRLEASPWDVTSGIVASR